MAKSYLCSFHGIFDLELEINTTISKIKKISIPMIQRDYAQGRTDPEITKIRRRFLDSLFKAVDGDAINLDFIYGNVDSDGEMTPLDGQQRLTTLFLLYWYASKKSNVVQTECDFLSKFTYKTRPSTRDFCCAIVKFTPKFNTEKLSDEIINQAWFPYDWKNDPSIGPMLVTLDDIDKKFADVENLWAKLLSDKITFYFLPIENMGLTDELYIKMNSRGKPLTTFEHFKAEFEHQLENYNQKKAKDLETKIDLQWTDFLWQYRKKTPDGNDQTIDDLFLNYFKFICDVICYKEGKSTQNRSYDEFDLINTYFLPDNKNIAEHIALLENSLDAFCSCKDVEKELFEEFLSANSVPDKARIVSPINQINLLKDCLWNYTDNSGRRGRAFPFGKFILLYAFVEYAMNKKTITVDQMRERIRMINNLVVNSNDEMNDSENRIGGNRLPAIIKQTQSIIVHGKILEGKIFDGKSLNFNTNQIQEEKAKMDWRSDNPNKVSSLNLLENHPLLYGQISVVGLENAALFAGFESLMNCDKDKISCALLSLGEYGRVEKGSKYSYGVDWIPSWEFLFHQSSADNFAGTKAALVALLSKYKEFDNKKLDDVIDDYLQTAEHNRVFDRKYYFIKYPSFRPNRFGKYLFDRNNPYQVYALWSEKYKSENAFQCFLKEIDPSHLDREDLGQRLKYDKGYVYCEKDKFVLKDFADRILDTLPIHQNKNGIDAEDRIEKYKSNPLIKT